jgi:hypothetical protein
MFTLVAGHSGGPHLPRAMKRGIRRREWQNDQECEHNSAHQFHGLSIQRADSTRPRFRFDDP